MEQLGNVAGHVRRATCDERRATWHEARGTWHVARLLDIPVLRTDTLPSMKRTNRNGFLNTLNIPFSATGGVLL
jgi:hypothetical protein